jgi:NFU1 iron-sulfur cluster scaffold homolog, mitochondrial
MQDVAYTFYCEETPNPSSMKFVANRLLLVSGGSAEYASHAETADAPLAKALFSFPFVRRLFFASNFISITKSENLEWIEIADELRVFLTRYMNEGKPVINRLPTRQVPKDSGFKETVEAQTQHSAPANEIENKIIEVLEQYIRPAVEQDGGLITFKELKDGVVTVQMRGSCSGCPSSTMTLKAGIEALLKRLLPDQVKEVVSEAV